MRLPIRVEPVALMRVSRLSARIRSPTVEPRPTTTQETPSRNTVGLEDLADDVLAGDGAERCFAGRLPHHRIAADKSQGAVPGPDRNREVEGGNDTDGPERVPLLHHAVHRPFALECRAGKRAAETDGIVADVDHFLHFPQAFGQDLAHFQRDESSQHILFLAQRDRKLTHDFASFGSRHSAPELERFHRLPDNRVVVGLARLFDFGQQFPGGRAVDFDPVTASSQTTGPRNSRPKGLSPIPTS